MNGLELSRAYYEAYGKPMLEKDFSDLLPVIATGLAGSGSECLGYDDAISRDHDFEPGFCIFLPGEDVVDRRTAFRLERAYAALPKEFLGFRRAQVQPVGGARHGVLRADAFFLERCGTADGILSPAQWLQVPEQSLLEATNGAVFSDPSGLMRSVRERLAFFPEDVRKKKLAGHLLLMGQSGQYNYTRCLQHGETGAAQLAAFAFTESTMQVVFLLNHRYRPYYKWSFRAMRALPKLSLLAELLEYLITSDQEGSNAEEKERVMEGIAADVSEELMEQKLTQAVCGDLEQHARSVNDSITDGQLRNMHLLAGIM